MLNVVLRMQEEKQTLVASRDNLDRLYRDTSNSLNILERSHRFTMSDLDHHRHELQASQDEVSRLGQLLSTKDFAIRELRASRNLSRRSWRPLNLLLRAWKITVSSKRLSATGLWTKSFALGGS
jgi:chromosome segregation ATPase